MKRYPDTTWHMQLFNLAYIEDRGWADALLEVLGGEDPGESSKAAKGCLTTAEAARYTRLREIKAAAQRRLDARATDVNGWHIFQTEKEEIRYHQLQELVGSTQIEQDRLLDLHYEEARREVSRLRSEALQDRLDGGTLNFCPYWRRVLFAIVVYLIVARCIVRPIMKPLGAKLERGTERCGMFLLRQLVRFYKFTAPFVSAHWKTIGAVVLILVVAGLTNKITLQSLNSATLEYERASERAVWLAKYDREAARNEALYAAERAAQEVAEKVEREEYLREEAEMARWREEHPYVPTRQDTERVLRYEAEAAEQEARAAKGYADFLYPSLLLLAILLDGAAYFYYLYSSRGVNVLAIAWRPFGWFLGRILALCSLCGAIVASVYYVVVFFLSLGWRASGIPRFFGDTRTFVADVWHQVHGQICPPVMRIRTK